MSQISSRINERRIGAVGTWSTSSPVVLDAAQKTVAHGRLYVRWLFATDLLILVTMLSLPAVSLLTGEENTLLESEYLSLFIAEGIALAITWMLVLQISQSRSLAHVAIGLREYKLVAGSTFAVAGGLGTYIGLTGHLELRVFLLQSMTLGLVALLVNRWTWRQWLFRRNRTGIALKNVVVFGSAVDVPIVLEQLKRNAAPAYRVVGVVVDGPDVGTVQAELAEIAPSLAISSADCLENDVARLDADSVVVAGHLTGGSVALQHLGWRLEKTATSLIVASAITGISNRRVHSNAVNGQTLMHIDSAKFAGPKYVLKRSFDIAFSSVALIALAPVFAVIALLIRIDGPGKVFFLQERAGQDGRPFKMIKFRTMVEDAEAQLSALHQVNEGSGPLFKLRNDPRITRCGRFLRQHSLDELPQFLNVFRGDMSVVGPRPPLFSEVEAYDSDAYRRLLIKPGVTGLWQVSGRSDLSWKECVRLDLYYAENWSVLGDLRIIGKTVGVMIKPDGAY